MRWIENFGRPAEFDDIVGKVWASKRAVFDKEDVQSLIGVIDMLARAPDEWLESRSRRHGRAGTPRLGFSEVPELLATCRRLIRLRWIRARTHRRYASSSLTSPRLWVRGELSPRLICLSQDRLTQVDVAWVCAGGVRKLEKIYLSEHVPKDDRAMTFAAATRVISAAMTHAEEDCRGGLARTSRRRGRHLGLW